jgi:hypothetical protein
VTVVVDRTIPPTVISYTERPYNGETQVASNTDVSAVFTKGMDPNTLTTSTFTLVKDGSATPVDATVSYLAGAKKVTLDPSSNLQENTKYSATIKGGT